MMKKVQQMRTMLPIGRSDDSSVDTTSFRPLARLITLYTHQRINTTLSRAVDWRALPRSPTKPLNACTAAIRNGSGIQNPRDESSYCMRPPKAPLSAACFRKKIFKKQAVPKHVPKSALGDLGSHLIPGSMGLPSLHSERDLDRFIVLQESRPLQHNDRHRDRPRYTSTSVTYMPQL